MNSLHDNVKKHMFAYADAKSKKEWKETMRAFLTRFGHEMDDIQKIGHDGLLTLAHEATKKQIKESEEE